MKTKPVLRTILFLIVSLSLLLSAAAPYTGAQSTVAAAEDLVRFNVINRSEKTMRIRLEGAAFYSLGVDAETSKIFTPARGKYNYTITACGITTRGALDLSTNKVLIQPKCSGGPSTRAGEPNTIDLNKDIKLVKVTLKNEIGANLMTVFTGTATYVFTFGPGDKKVYTIGRGDYTISYYGCGQFNKVSFTARANSNLTFKCTK